MKKIIKITAVSAFAMALALYVMPATQAYAWGGCCGGYGSYGGYYNQGYYNAPATQQRTTPQTYTAPQTTQPRVQSNTNNFDPTIFDIQTVLFEKGYYDGDLDGLYGTATKAAWLSFQKYNDIAETKNPSVTTLKSDITTLEALGLLKATGL